MKQIFFTLFFFVVATFLSSAQTTLEIENPNLNICFGSGTENIELEITTTGNPTHYKIISDSFMNMDTFALFQDEIIIIEIDFDSVSAGNTYLASLTVATDDSGTDESAPAFFSISVLPVFDSGTINGGETTVCIGTSIPTITGTAATGGDGNISYLWKRNGTDIPDSDFSTFTPSETGTYTRSAKDGLCNTTFTLSGGGNFVVSYYAAFSAGAIQTTGQTICSGATANVIGSATLPTGGDLSYTYQWRRNGLLVPGASGSTHTPTDNTAGTYHYTREVKDGTCAPNFVNSNGVWTLTVQPAFNAGAIVSTPQTVCAGATAAPIGSTTNASGGNGVITYQWKKDGEVISSSNAATYTPTQSGVYTREAKDGSCSGDFLPSTGSCTVTFSEPFSAGNILANNETVCLNAQPAQIGNLTEPTGGTPPYTYQWKNNGIVISGATAITYTPTPQTQPEIYYYTREVKDSGCALDFTPSDGVCAITVLPNFSAGEILDEQKQLCAGEQPDIILSVKDATGGDGNITYQWKCNNVVIADAKEASYKPTPQTTAGNYKYTREAHENKCATTWVVSDKSYQLVITQTINSPETPKGNTLLCNGTENSEYSVTPVQNANSYIWELLPATAGTVVGNDVTISIFWKNDFTGEATLKVKALSNCGTSDFSNSLKITLLEPLQTSFISAPNPVCGNQKGLLYEVEPLNNATYQWFIDSEKGEIVNTENNKATINWNSAETASTTYIRVDVLKDNCTTTVEQPVAIFDSNAPELNEIVAKTNIQGIPYILIYPNPADEYIYQWYEDGNLIPDATKQFYYPPNYENRKLEVGVNYSVFVAEVHSAACGSFTENYTLSKNDLTAETPPYFNVFPNPVTHHSFFISFNKEFFNEHDNDFTLFIYSSMGEKVWEQKLNSLEELNINKPLAKGIYLITLMCNNKQYTEKILVQ